MQRKYIYLLLFCLLLVPAGVVMGQSASTNFTTQRFVLAGGDSAESSSYRSTNVTGQATTTLARSSNYSVSGGFLFPLKNSVPTAATLSSATSTSLAPFWLLLATAMLLLFAAVWLQRHQSR